ncbi:MAG: hypothetical protein DRQ88_07865 [Epsilonproteobacteria bacterium]|nr:MAG: hypothetical protein DRQ89_07265 [Campylobacterota bacterium]RLA66109.1 MAG: hypothetical protein DRQ88_07865 [Campylobacterota bacterium]
MTTKVLVAEDSLTVQKVINFTLESEPFELDYCKDEDELFSKFKKGEYNLIFLDMNLSSSKTGYDLAKELRLVDPDIKILGLFGTFDVIENNSLKESGIGAQIIKPFESAKFIKACRNLVGIEAGLSQVSFEEEVAAEDDWSVNAPDLEAQVKEELPSKEQAEEDLKSWGIDIPGVIEDKVEDMVMDESLLEEGAELIETMNLIEPEEDNELDEIALPSDEDLELPEQVVQMTTVSEPVVEETREISHIPAPEINIEEDIDEDMSPEDFWAADETQIVAIEADKGEVTESITTPIEISDEIMAKIKESIGPLIEMEVKKYCEKTLEKVAWEVIPELAENLIRKEIKEIAKSED